MVIERPSYEPEDMHHHLLTTLCGTKSDLPGINIFGSTILYSTRILVIARMGPSSNAHMVQICSRTCATRACSLLCTFVRVSVPLTCDALAPVTTALLLSYPRSLAHTKHVSTFEHLLAHVLSWASRITATAEVACTERPLSSALCVCVGCVICQCQSGGGGGRQGMGGETDNVNPNPIHNLDLELQW